MTPPYSVLQSIALSFFSPRWYRYAAREWTIGRALFHLLVLLALTWAIALAKIHRDMTAYAAGPGRRIVEQVPPITLAGGKLSTPEAHPYSVTDPETGKTLAVIDTTQSQPPDSASDAQIVVTRDRIVVRRSALDSRTFDVSELVTQLGVKEGTLTPDELTTLLSALATWLPTILFPVLLAFSYIYRLAHGVLYALVGLVFGNLLRVPLAFDAAFRLGVVAMTPAVALQTVAELAGQELHGVLYVLVALGYLFTAVQSNSERADAESGEAAET